VRDHYCRPVSIASINPQTFPDVALYTKTGNNYVLYKPHDRKFTEMDRMRLERNFVEFLYVRTGDMEEVTAFLEAGLSETLSRNDLNVHQKGQILYQTTVNYVIEVFENPEEAAKLDRCRNLVKHLLQHLSSDTTSLSAVHTLADHNYYIFVHSLQVAALALLVHEEVYGLTPEEMFDVGIGGLLHDLGMIFISNNILEKPDALNDLEYYKIKRHAQLGYECLHDIGGFSEISLAAVRHHHERYDGDGYPAALKGDKIPRTAQVMAICDVYSALTTDRIYRKSVSHEKALETMRTEMHGAFNPELLKRFIEIITARKQN
jgi:HD-GYP domain-containing protein (c-di-GMP phosphodiesterase class II)